MCLGATHELCSDFRWKPGPQCEWLRQADNGTALRGPRDDKMSVRLRPRNRSASRASRSGRGADLVFLAAFGCELAVNRARRDPEQLGRDPLVAARVVECGSDHALLDLL